MNKITAITCGALFGAIMVWALIALVNSNQNQANQQSQSAIEEDGVQVIRVLARNGYSPRKILAKANVRSRLEIETKGSYDCSTSFRIPDLNYKKQLPSTGITKIDIPAQNPGSSFIGLCSMGMYSFEVDFD